jgi:capsular exopolysaccharide synthesis family protein
VVDEATDALSSPAPDPVLAEGPDQVAELDAPEGEVEHAPVPADPPDVTSEESGAGISAAAREAVVEDVSTDILDVVSGEGGEAGTATPPTRDDDGGQEEDPEVIIVDETMVEEARPEDRAARSLVPQSLGFEASRGRAVGSAGFDRRGTRDSATINDGNTEGLGDLTLYWSLIRNQYRLVLSIAAVVLLAVVVGTAFQTPIYRATATVEIRRQAAEAVPVETLFESGAVSGQYLETQYEILNGRDLARHVVEALQLASLEEFNPDAGSQDQPGRTAESVERATRRFQDRLMIDPVRDSRLVRIYFESEDPVLAAIAASGVVDEYIQMRIAAGHEAVERLEGQADSVRERLVQAEAALQDFSERSGLSFLERGGGGTENLAQQRLRSLEEQLTEAQADGIAKASQYELIQRGDLEAFDSEVLQSLSVGVAELSGEYARLRSTFTDSFPRTREVKQQLEAMQGQLANERQRIASEIRGAHDAAERREQLLRGAVRTQRDSVAGLSGKLAEYRIVEREVAAHQDLYASLQQKKQEAEISAALAATEIGIVDRAEPPPGPIRPNGKRNAALGLIVGLILGIGAALLRELTDPTLRTADEVRAMSDVPILGLIPAVAVPLGTGEQVPERALSPRSSAGKAAADKRSWYRIDKDDGRQAALSEAFGGLRTSVLFDHESLSPRVLQVTSPHPGAGKTTVATNLAISLSRLGHAILLVDADLRKPSVHRALDLGRASGLAEYLAGYGSWGSYVRPDVVPGVDVLTAGAPADDPSELLSSGRMGQLIDEGRLGYDFVIVDSPAVFVNVPDARIISLIADGLVLVVRSRITRRETVSQMLRELPRVLGVVLNDVEGRHFPAYYSDYRSDDSFGGPAGVSAAAGPDGGIGLQDIDAHTRTTLDEDYR